jgi:hypothetical protein
MTDYDYLKDEHRILNFEEVQYLYENNLLTIINLEETYAYNFTKCTKNIGYVIKRTVNGHLIPLCMKVEDIVKIRNFLTEKYGWGYKPNE